VKINRLQHELRLDEFFRIILLAAVIAESFRHSFHMSHDPANNKQGSKKKVDRKVLLQETCEW
jgi:hypothetical protein